MHERWSKLLHKLKFALTYKYLGSDLNPAIAECTYCDMYKSTSFFSNFFYSPLFEPLAWILCDVNTKPWALKLLSVPGRIIVGWKICWNVNTSSKQWNVLSVQDCASVAHLNCSNECLGVLVYLLLRLKRDFCLGWKWFSTPEDDLFCATVKWYGHKAFNT